MQSGQSFRLRIKMVLLSYAPIPETRREQHQGTSRGEANQEWRRQHEPGRDGGPGRQRAAEVTVVGAGSCVLGAFVQQQLNGSGVASQSGFAFSGTHDS